jgi:hypothetical protein
MRSKQALEGFAIDQKSKEKILEDVIYCRDDLLRCSKEKAVIDRMLHPHRETEDE